MSIYKETSQQTMLTLTTQDENGNHVQAVVVSCNIRPGRGLSINMDVLAPSLIQGEKFNDIAAAATEYLYDELAKAAQMDIPIDVEYALEADPDKSTESLTAAPPAGKAVELCAVKRDDQLHGLDADELPY